MATTFGQQILSLLNGIHLEEIHSMHMATSTLQATTALSTAMMMPPANYYGHMAMAVKATAPVQAQTQSTVTTQHSLTLSQTAKSTLEQPNTHLTSHSIKAVYTDVLTPPQAKKSGS